MFERLLGSNSLGFAGIEFALITIAVACMVGANPVGAADFVTPDGTVSVDDWGYQLQGLGGSPLLPAPLAAAAHELLVIDYSRDGSAGQQFTSQEVDELRNSAPTLGGDGQRKIVAAYLSIGEASEFRAHWNPIWTTNGLASGALTASAPSWLGPVNPDFPESRKVRYWESEWQDVIFNGSGTGWLDEIVAQGFDAAYLDIVDAYYFWAAEVDPGDRVPGDPLAGDEKDAAGRMIDFVVALTAHARATVPSFFVIPQNGDFIMDALEDEDPARKTAYLDAIGAIGVEGAYYIGNQDENNPLNPDMERIAILKSDYLVNGKAVFVVEYLNIASLISEFYGLARADGFIPYAAPLVALDSLASPAPPVPLVPGLSRFGLTILVGSLGAVGLLRKRANYSV